MIFHKAILMKYHTYFFRKLGKMSQSRRLLLRLTLYGLNPPFSKSCDLWQYHAIWEIIVRSNDPQWQQMNRQKYLEV